MLIRHTLACILLVIFLCFSINNSSLASTELLTTKTITLANTSNSPSATTTRVRSLYATGSIPFRAFTDKDGLPQNSAMAMAFDQNGYLWIGTQDGAAFYNGYKWTTVNMPNRRDSNSIQTMLSTEDGSLWFGTNGGGLVQLKNNTWTVHNKKSGALNNNIVKTLLAVKSPSKEVIIWVGTENGLSCFQENKWKTYTTNNSELPNDKIESLAINKSAKSIYSLWIGTHGGGVVKLENNSWTTYNSSNSALPNNIVRSLLTTDNNGKESVWIGTQAGLARLREKSSTNNQDEWVIYNTNNSPLPHTIIRCLYQTNLKNGLDAIWIGTLTGLACLVEPSNSSEKAFWKIYNSQNSDLPVDYIVSFLVLPESSTLWIGTNGGGIVRAQLTGWQTFSTKTSPLPNNIVRALLEVKTNTSTQLWIGTYDGLTCLEEENWTNYNTSNSALPDNNIETLLQTTENGQSILWVGTWGGLVKIEKDKWTLYNTNNSGLPENRVMSLLETTNNGKRILWVGTTGGLACLESGKWSTYTTQNSPLPHNQIDVMLETHVNGNQNIWLGTWGGGVARLEQNIDSDLDITKLISAYKWTVYNTENSELPNNLVKTIRETTINNQQLIWIGTNGGLVYFSPSSLKQPWKVLSDTTTPALPNNIISQIIFTPQDQIFIPTFKGIARLTPKTSFDINNLASFDIYTFTTEDGLPGNGVNPRTTILDSQNHLWVGTLYGLAMLDLNNFINDKRPKKLYIEHFFINGNSYKQSAEKNSSVSLESPSPISKLLNDETLSYYQNNIVFEYALLSYFKEADTSYQIQLVGLDKNISDWSKEHRKEYTNLGFGSYKFLVWAKDGQGNISGPISLAFQINPAPWFTWWAMLIYIAITSGSTYGAFAWRIRILTQRQKRKMLHLRQLQEQRIESLRQLLKSIQIINSQLDLETVLHNITAESARLVDGEPGSIGLITDGKLIFKHLWYKGKLEEINLEFSLGEGIAGRVAESGKPYIVNDIYSDANVAQVSLAEKYAPFGFIEIPIIDRRSKVLGVLDIRRTANRGPFTEVDIHLLEALAHQAALALENASLYGALEEKNLALEEKNLIIAESLQEIEKLYQNEQEVSRTLQELNQMKSNFMIITSHEMRTPLTILRGNHEALLAQTMGELTPRQQKSLLACQRAIERMIESVENINQAIKISEKQIKLNYEEVNINYLLNKILNKLSQFIKQRQQTITLDLPEKIILIADSEKLQLLLTNIIQNAIKFTLDGGNISISATQENQTIHIIVKDDGIGIEKAELDKIFDQFYTHSDTLHHTSGKYQFSARGSGLGLTIAKGYIEAHNGKIWAESKGNNFGSSFHILLPINPTSQIANVDFVADNSDKVKQ